MDCSARWHWSKRSMGFTSATERSTEFSQRPLRERQRLIRRSTWRACASQRWMSCSARATRYSPDQERVVNWIRSRKSNAQHVPSVKKSGRLDSNQRLLAPEAISTTQQFQQLRSISAIYNQNRVWCSLGVFDLFRPSVWRICGIGRFI